MVNHTKMDSKKAIDILNKYKNKSNKDLLEVLDFLNEDFNKTKELIIKLTHHLDSTEISYNKVLEEINKRVDNNGR
jgi:hypothetical protein